MYYLHSRYYDPTTCRFINADAFTSTGQGMLGRNMFAYCNNNPVNGSDRSGFAQSSTDDINYNGIPDYLEERWIELTNRCRAMLSGKKCRIVTAEINAALERATCLGKSISKLTFLTRPYIFYLLVNHNAVWDIKREDPWEYTIETTYPGSYDTVVIYEGHYYTPEILGNYTYGALGKAYGFDLDVLFLGSAYAAGFPPFGTSEHENEMSDWLFISNGYYSGH